MTLQTITVKHNAETAHRLPFLRGKCENLHGHSWGIVAEFVGQPDIQGILVDYGDLKKEVRKWVDDNLDHGCMLGSDDTLIAPLQRAGCKTYIFGEGIAEKLYWPTVENVALLLLKVFTSICDDSFNGRLSVYRVEITETAVNQATVYND